ncbi:MAG: tyrosine-type recombinase/integrase [Solirubrobacteraceae bacterium]
MGAAPEGRQADLVGDPARGDPRVRAVSRDDRPADRDPAQGSAARPRAAARAVYGVLRVHGKDDKWREVPLHPSTTHALSEYARLRDRHWTDPKTPAFFVCSTGERLKQWVVHKTFPPLIRQVGLEGCGQRARPRPHDFRHSYAVQIICSAGCQRLVAVGSCRA